MNEWIQRLFEKAKEQGRDVSSLMPLCTGHHGKCRQPAPFRVSYDLRSDSARDKDWIEPVEADHCEACCEALMKYAKGNPQISDLRVNDRSPVEAED